MNSIDTSPNLRASIKPARVLPHVRDRSFLPAAIEIVETPPAPMAIWLMLTICGFLAAALVWCWFGRLDVYATARGKIEPVGQAKVIGPLRFRKGLQDQRRTRSECACW